MEVLGLFTLTFQFLCVWHCVWYTWALQLFVLSQPICMGLGLLCPPNILTPGRSEASTEPLQLPAVFPGLGLCR